MSLALLVVAQAAPTPVRAVGEPGRSDPPRRHNAAGEAPEDGEWIAVSGQVTDGQGDPIAGVRVVFEAFRSYFSLRHLERREKDFRRVETVTDADGRYRLEWLWDDYFNRFRVGAAVPLYGSSEEKLHFLQRVDLGRRLAAGGSAVVPLVLEDTSFLDAVRRFEASIESEEQRRIYRELGYPDEVQMLELSTGREASWWYFDRGKVYRFADGELQEVEPFEPVRSF